MSEIPLSVTPSTEPDPPQPPGLRRGTVLALTIAAVVALAAITVTAVRTGNTASMIQRTCTSPTACCRS